MFLFLDAQNAEPERMAQLEWGWMRVLEDTQRGAKILHTQVLSSPQLFVDLLKAVFRGEGEPPETVVSDDQRTMAEHAYRLLKDIHTVPGYRLADNGEGLVDPFELRNWVDEARKLAQQAGQLGICDSQIGEILSFAPTSPDGSWPCVEVRNLIEGIRSPEMENGLVIGKCNQRGVVTRGAGGKQEWDLAAKFRGLAEIVRNGWPRTAGILDCLAEGYEAEARRWDEEEKRNEFE